MDTTIIKLKLTEEVSATEIVGPTDSELIARATRAYLRRCAKGGDIGEKPSVDLCSVPKGGTTWYVQLENSNRKLAVYVYYPKRNSLVFGWDKF